MMVCFKEDNRWLFTPNEIRNKEFTRVKNGLEPAEVSDF